MTIVPQLVLIIEDHDPTLGLLQMYLRDAPFDCVFAASAKAGLEVYERAMAEGRPVDLIVTDGAMPEMSGFQLATAIRESGDADTPIILLTAYDDPIAKPRAQLSGIRDIWFKPDGVVKILELITAALEALRQSRGG